MNKLSQFNLKPHHIGIVLPKNIFHEKFTTLTNFDSIQGVYTYFEFKPEFGLYIEYFTPEGRAINYPKGFNHICYSVNNILEFKDFQSYVKTERIGKQLTLLEKSGSAECNKVAFFEINYLGMIEINVLND
jgi:hypothetical protein